MSPRVPRIISLAGLTAIVGGGLFTGLAARCHAAADDAKPAAEASVLTGLGDLPGGLFSSRANGVSADGQVAVGCCESQRGPEAFRWTSCDGMVGLGDLEGGSFESVAAAASADGSVVVGYGTTDGMTSRRAYRWTASSGLVVLPDHEAGEPVEAVDVSADGTIIAGTLQLPRARKKAFTWTADGGYRLLDSEVTIASRKFDAITDVFSLSGDGKIAAGFVKFNEVDFLQACLWVEGLGAPLRRSEFNEGVPYYLQDFIGTRTVCTAVAKDCVAVIGRHQNKRRYGSRGFHVLDGKFTWLDSSTCALTSPQAISGDGRTVVGRGLERDGNDEVACLWRQGLGVRSLAQHLANASVRVGDWKLTEATGVSKDGRVIVGNGVNPSGQKEAWIVRLPQ